MYLTKKQYIFLRKLESEDFRITKASKDTRTSLRNHQHTRHEHERSKMRQWRKFIRKEALRHIDKKKKREKRTFESQSLKTMN